MSRKGKKWRLARKFKVCERITFSLHTARIVFPKHCKHWQVFLSFLEISEEITGIALMFGRLVTVGKMSKSQSFAPKTSAKIPESERAWNFSGTGNMFREYLLRDDLIRKEKENESENRR